MVGLGRGSTAMRGGLVAFVIAAALGACAGRAEDADDVDTSACVSYCERRQQRGCNELGSIENCRLACGLLLTEAPPCGPASKKLLDCRLAQPDICRGCMSEQSQASAACM